VSDDVGASTIQSTLPVKRWIFLSFTFMNNNSSTAESMSKEGQPDLELTSKCVTVLNAKGEVVAAQATPKPDPSDDNRRFIYSVYINGELDIAVSFFLFEGAPVF
jgi:hypothetical protein